MQPVIPVNMVPKSAATRNTEYRYPWGTLQPGECFEFSPNAKLNSARVMCTNNGSNLGRKFRCFRGVDGRVYAQRMDGVVVDKTTGQMTVAPILKHGEAPAVGEDFGTFGEGCTEANNSLLMAGGHALPPSSAPEIERRLKAHAEVIKKAAIKPDKDVI